VVSPQLNWTITGDGLEHAAPGDEDWASALRRATAANTGVVRVSRATSFAKLFLRFAHDLAFLEYWASADQQILVAQFINKRAVVNSDVEMPCWGYIGCGCGPPMFVPARYVLHRADGTRLFLQYLRTGTLPSELDEPLQERLQLALPGMERLVIPWAVANAVEWTAPWPDATPRYIGEIEETDLP
jgi:hypothetical protein